MNLNFTQTLDSLNLALHSLLTAVLSLWNALGILPDGGRLAVVVGGGLLVGGVTWRVLAAWFGAGRFTIKAVWRATLRPAWWLLWMMVLRPALWVVGRVAAADGKWLLGRKDKPQPQIVSQYEKTGVGFAAVGVAMANAFIRPYKFAIGDGVEMKEAVADARKGHKGIIVEIDGSAFNVNVPVFRNAGYTVWVSSRQIKPSATAKETVEMLKRNSATPSPAGAASPARETPCPFAVGDEVVITGNRYHGAPKGSIGVVSNVNGPLVGVAFPGGLNEISPKDPFVLDFYVSEVERAPAAKGAASPPVPLAVGDTVRLERWEGLRRIGRFTVTCGEWEIRPPRGFIGAIGDITEIDAGDNTANVFVEGVGKGWWPLDALTRPDGSQTPRQPAAAPPAPAPTAVPRFKVGDRVKVKSGLLGAGNAGGLVGSIVEVCCVLKHPYKVLYDEKGIRSLDSDLLADDELELLPQAPPAIEVGDTVKTLPFNMDLPHPGFVANMTEYVGKLGRVERIDQHISTGEYARVQFNDEKAWNWQFCALELVAKAGAPPAGEPESVEVEAAAPAAAEEVGAAIDLLGVADTQLSKIVHAYGYRHDAEQVKLDGTVNALRSTLNKIRDIIKG